jgi:hypothetical protein
MKNKQKEILELIRFVQKDRSGNKNYIDFGALTKKEVTELSEIAGVNLDGYVRTLDAAGIIHALKHRNIDEADLLLIPFIVANYDIIGYGTKDNTLVYKKLIGQEYFYVEEIRKGRKKLVIKTLYKRKKRQTKV